MLGITLLIAFLSTTTSADIAKETCNQGDDKQIFWGDLHVHSGYSLDAWGYGTKLTPAESYAFAKGAAVTLPHGERVKLDRPLDFMAVTDHAEWFNLMHVCTDPQYSSHDYCKILTLKNTPETGTEVFSEYVLPTITKAQPQPTPLCEEDPSGCRRAHLSEWQRIQDQTNEAYEPCTFTSFIGWEWSATPDYSHNHRNVIFANANVTADAIDYMRYPTPELLWRELERQCRPEDGCDVIAIPHNTNMGDGKSFDVETESVSQRLLRAKYERLVEIHQEKGNSECLPAFGTTDEDCNFETRLTKNSRPATEDDYTAEEWERMRGSYVRRLLLRGLYSFKQSGDAAVNPLQLGIIGSTDNHAGTGGFVDEQNWPGSVFGLGSFERSMSRSSWNPGGLVAVWAEQNTRESIFTALKRREVYATSGPRIRLKLEASPRALTCEPGSADNEKDDTVPMGGTITRPGESISLRIMAQADDAPIQTIEIVKGDLHGDELRERVERVWHRDSGAHDVCVTWKDEHPDAAAPAFWYARVLEAPTPRWTAYQCRRAGRCDEYEDVDLWIRERAWSSPVWYLPEPGR